MSQYRSENHSVNSATEPLGLKTDSKTKNRLAFKVIKNQYSSLSNYFTILCPLKCTLTEFLGTDFLPVIDSIF